MDTRVHAAYYSWYGNPTTDGMWLHWNHEVLDGSGNKFVPPDDIGANYYPELGCYSSLDRALVEEHVRQFVRARIGVLNFSWWGRQTGDGQGGVTDHAVEMTMDVCAEYGVQVTFHLEPYTNRSAATTREDIAYILNKYGSHPAFYRLPVQRVVDGVPTIRQLPLFYVYDSYLTPAAEWAEILNPASNQTIRNTELDSVMMGLYVFHDSKAFLLDGHFDGFYTYFATDGFTDGSTTANWPEIIEWANQNNLVSQLSIGPGYNDTRIRPWNAANARERNGLEYYTNMFTRATAVRPTLYGFQCRQCV
eukprot:TRINITY_DN3492_c0_g1_i2.p1 TRINITY_DN3492_c0_g1~~TRINITY_DN3492_c0_g1_i2.p1  ORF type:complete len:327 (+),score=56.98 TRINITY_DN3492_c0_g1_i2:65-982(+)